MLSQFSREKLELMRAIEATRQRTAAAGKRALSVKELYEELLDDDDFYCGDISLAAVKKAASLLTAMASAGLVVSQAALIALLTEKAADEASDDY